MHTIILKEYDKTIISAALIDRKDALRLNQALKGKIEIKSSLALPDKYELYSFGWVGHVPLGRNLTAVIQPKVPIGNLFSMLETVYKLDLTLYPDSITQTDSVDGFYNFLAKWLAEKTLSRVRRGLYKTYVDHSENLSAVRGRINVAALSRQSTHATLPCEFDEQTADIAHNQLLAHTLNHILHSDVLTDAVRPTVRRAFRALPVSRVAFSLEDCLAIRYSRLNEDYRPLHAICRFFLDNTTPSHTVGQNDMLPFLVPMDKLFEQFVYEWLHDNLSSSPYSIKKHVKGNFDTAGVLSYDIDLVILDQNRQPLIVLDTKYKHNEKPRKDDFNQILAYALGQETNDAVLIYPFALKNPYSTHIQNIHTRAATFDLAQNLNTAGQTFLQSLNLP